ncbi:MAG TPA: C25 family cysteine peptidase, partial [bacterium]
MRKGLWIFLLAVPLVCSAASEGFMPLRTDIQGERPEVAILQHNQNQVVMEIKLPGLILSEGTLEGKRWDRVEIPGGARGYELGAPEIPHFTRLLIVPATKGVRAEFEALETTTFDDIELMPYQQFQPDEPIPEGERVRYDMAAYSLDALYPQDPVMAGEPATMRGLRVVGLRTHPVQYNPATKELRVATRYRVTIHFEGTDLRNVPRRQFALSKTWAKMMRGVSFNFDDSEMDEQNMGSYLIVCENNSTLLANLTPLIDWKRRKGHTVAVSTFADGASTATIKNLIQTAYDNWPVPPEYVLLFGDTDSGSGYRLQGWSPSGIDHPYSQLDGTDILADVAIGRLPADDPAQTAIMINKVLFYEKMPYIATPEWYKQGCLVAGSSSSGYSTIQTNRWIKTRMIQHEFTRIDTFWYNMGGSSVATTINNAINNVGISYLNYRGYLGMENFEASHISAMTNGRKMPFITTITCSTGGFDGASFMELFVTTGSATAGNAAVACIGTATSSTSTRFNNAVAVGIYAGIFDEGITQAGPALVRGKLELYWAHNPAEPWEVSSYSLWNALAGDPGLELFNGAIHFMTCDVPATATLGDNALNLTVNETGVGPLEGATVCVYKDSSLQYVAETDAGGLVTMPLTGIAAGNIKVTVTKHNFYPILDSLDIVQAAVAVGYYSHTINDDNVGGSSGDNDGVLNPGETVEIPLVFKNYGTSTTATGVSVAATESDPYGNLIDAGETFPDIAPGATSNSADDFDLAVAANCPNGQVIRLNLTTTSAQGSWDGLLDLPVVSYDMHLTSAQATGGDTLVSPGETSNFVLYVRNAGAKNAVSLTATLVSLDSYVTVNDNSASFGNVNINAAANCSGNPFNITAAANAPPGHLA